MSELLSAKQSPRYENNKFYWFEEDTFAIELNITLTNLDTGENILLEKGDEIIVSFYQSGILVHKFVFDTFDNGNIVTLNFNDAVTKKFPVGEYNYTITYKGVNTTTIVANNIAEVEKCLQ